MMRTTIGYFVVIMAVVLVAGCSGNARKSSLEEGFLDYNEVEMVSFSLSGNVKCTDCTTDEDDILGIEIEVRLANDPTHTMAIQLEDSLGFFQMDGLRAPAGSEIEVRALMRTSSSRTARIATETTHTPDDGGVAIITLDFTPSTDN